MIAAALPEFENPPVGEVALSVQFPTIAKLHAAHLGLFWREIDAQYPVTETHPPIASVIEKFEKPAPIPGPQLRLRHPPTVPRAWFISADGTHLIQIQADRFICNWRRIKPSDSYHRYPSVRASFEDLWPRWNNFLLKQALIDSPLSVEQCEVTYTNHIAREGAWQDYREAHKVLRLLEAPTELQPELAGEFVSFATHYQILGGGAGERRQSIGRLHVEFDPGINAQSGEPIFILNLVARGLVPEAQGGVLGFFDLGRRLIVTSFKEITTPEMHKVWKLRTAE